MEPTTNPIDAIRRLPLAQQVVAGAAVLVAVVALALFARWVSEPAYTVLYSNLEETQLATVIDELEAQNIPYKLEGGGARILVPRPDVYRVRATLASEGIRAGVVPEGYEVLDQQGLSVSDFRQRVDFRRAMEGELAKTLLAMEAVTYANVHLVIPEEALFAEDQDPVTASVLVDSSRSLTEDEVETITHLVASAVEGLEPNDVTVAHVSGAMLHAPGDPTDGSAVGNRNLRMTRDFESALAADVTRLLATVVGSGRASVVVRAALDFDERTVESETYDEASATALREQVIDERFSGTGTPPAGTVGVDGEAVDVDGDGAYDYSRNELIREYGVDRVVSRSVDAPGEIQRLSVAVVVDDGSLTGVAVPSASELESLVGAAIGLDPARGDTIEVSLVPFPATEAAEPVDRPAAASSPLDLVPQAVGALVLVVAAVGLLLMSRGGRKKDAPIPVPAPESLPLGDDVPDAAPAPALVGAPVGSDLEADVLDLVQRQPEEIATLLRSWLADRREDR